MGSIYKIFDIHPNGKLNLFASPPVDFWFARNGFRFLVWLQLTAVRLLSGSRGTVQLFAWLWSGPGLAVRCVCQAVPVLCLMPVRSGLTTGLVRVLVRRAAERSAA